MSPLKALIKKNFLLNLRNRKELVSELTYLLLSTIFICYFGNKKNFSRHPTQKI